MKNTLFFNDSFAPILLENEETDTDELRNAIFLRFRTTAATNQKLYITVRNAEYEEDLDPDTDYDYRLEGTYWAAGGVTKLQLKNDELISVFTQITFPEIISTDAALLESSGFNHAYYMQGKEDKDEELRQQVITYANGTEYNITPESVLPKIIEIKFASVLANTQALFNATINLSASQIEEAGDITFRIRVNRVFDETFIPIQTVRDGRYIVTISYPIRNVSQSDRNQIDVYLTTSAGNIQIEQGQIRASVTASGLSSSEAFTGDIEWLELLGTVEVPIPYAVIIPVAETASVSVSSNDFPKTFTELIGPATLQSGRVTISPITEEPAIGRMVLYYTINTERAGQYSYNRAYVNIQADEFSLNESYPFLSEVDTIDSGSLKACDVELSAMQLASKTGLSVVASGEVEQGLPAEYQEVEYIQSSGTQYIDTGVSLRDYDQNLDVVIDMDTLSTTSGVQGLSNNAQSGKYWFSLPEFDGSTWYLQMAAGTWATVPRVTGRTLLKANSKTGVIQAGNNSRTVRSDSFVSAAGTSTNNGNLYLFASNNWGGTPQPVNGRFSARLYSAVFKNATTGDVIKNLVPCYRKADGEIGLYDKANQEFITNAGSGTFTKGADVPSGSTYKTLISDGTDVYTVSSGALSASVGLLANLSASMFSTYGFTNLSDCTDAQSDILALNDFQVLRWISEPGDISTMVATVSAIPTQQTITTPVISLTNFNVSGIELVTTDTEGNPRAAISFDGGGFEYYDTIDQEWKAEGAGSRGYMTVADLEDITEAMWDAKLYGVTTMQTKFILPTVNDTVAEIQYKFLNE